MSCLYRQLTGQVLGMTCEPDFDTIGQQTVFDYLHRFIQSLSTDALGKLLRFVTGYSVGHLRLALHLIMLRVWNAYQLTTHADQR